MAKYKADRRLWFTADKARVIEEGDADAAFLYLTPGKEVSEEEARAFGLVSDEPKGKAAPANKARTAPENKGKE